MSTLIFAALASSITRTSDGIVDLPEGEHQSYATVDDKPSSITVRVPALPKSFRSEAGKVVMSALEDTGVGRAAIEFRGYFLRLRDLPRKTVRWGGEKVGTPFEKVRCTLASGAGTRVLGVSTQA